MTDRDPNHLCEPLRVIYQEWLDRCTAAGLQVKAIVTYRSGLDQDVAKQNGLSNASAGQSPHNCTDANGNPASKAFDFGIFEDHGVYITDGTDDRYRQAAEIGEQLGLEWGGRWLHPDFDHLEMANWKASLSPAS
jgi:hypothetical protein